ncbi:hypothetical protein Misp01_50510 [Microtetraspora sp. NBRC 13810]|uniref:hypothetical protein n=1 Tax=Microtetraspora sp. NBRC 13810 TaxID=3030990 RepID=UPI0024A02845|nr:hypothetical protein [Microtetraspora sp. NBRC 13810]GLW09922.1 hypothetical protein Misp01_50510 [Microtetraspora sp. NBRC 13810]
MPEKPLLLSEIAVLVALLGEVEEISNPDLHERYGVTLVGENRRNLNDLKLVESRKVGRAYVHMLTDLGWARVAQEVREGTVATPNGAAGALVKGLLVGFRRFMERTDNRLADIYALPVAPVVSEVDVESRIRAAYAELAERPADWVSLTKLRPRLGDVPKAEVDEALLLMNRRADVNIVPESNQKTLTAADREAAVTIGDQEKHFIAIGVR